jgi:hypothetical protein
MKHLEFLGLRVRDRPEAVRAVSKQAFCFAAAGTKSRPTESACWSESLPGPAFYNRFLPDFFAAAQRARAASPIRLRAAADILRFSRALVAELVAALFELPGGLPRRFPVEELPPTPTKACIAASSLLRSSLSCWTISVTFMELY